MKAIFKLALFFILSIGLTFCKKRTEITYPSSISYGPNILSLNDGSALDSSQPHGFGATLGKKAKLKIIITNTSIMTNTNSPGPTWFYESNTGWTISEYNTSNNTQTFTSTQTDKIDVSFSFIGPGSCQVDYYENSSSITKTKHFTWN